jgi:hypothetical protein
MQPSHAVTDWLCRLGVPRALTATAAAAGVIVLVAGCGGGSSNLGVANAGTTKTSTSAASAPSSAAARQSGLLYSRCMRAHGVPDFPDSAVSVTDGQVEIHIPRNIKREASLLSASQACQRDLPVSSGTPAKHRNIQADLKFAKCMRSHGITDFPDPMPGGGFNISGNTDSPQFEAAAKACQWTAIHWNGP